MINQTISTEQLYTQMQQQGEQIDKLLAMFEMMYVNNVPCKETSAAKAYAKANKRDAAKNKATQAKVCHQSKPRKDYETKHITPKQARETFELEYIGQPPVCMQVGTHLWLQWKNKPTDKVRKALKDQGFKYHEKRFGEGKGKMFWHLAR